jgi:hypothetical protein
MRVSYLYKSCLFAFSLTCLSMLAFPALSSPEKQDLLPLLEGFEWKLAPEQFLSLPDDTYLTLMEIAKDPNLLAFYRGRALVALSLYSNNETWLYFENAIENALSKSEKRRALEGICEIFSDTRNEALKELLRPELQNEDIRFRMIAFQCLRNLQVIESDLSTETALKHYEKSIVVDWERQQIQR